MNTPLRMLWELSNRANNFSRQMADRHYSRQSIGTSQKLRNYTMTTKNSKTHLQPQDWKQNYKAWLNELKNLRTKKTPKRVPVSRIIKIDYDTKKTPKNGYDYNNFYDDGMTANRNYLSEEELKWII